MRILAIDTALSACAAAVLDTATNAVLARESQEMERGHAEALLPLVARVMDRAGLDFAQLDRYAVTVGPGSFTGLRVGVSAARGLSLASGRPAVGLSTLAALAAPHIATDPNTAVVSVIDARHGNLYLQVFGAGGRSLVAPCVVTLAEAAAVAAKRPAWVVGSGARVLIDAAPELQSPLYRVEPKPAPDIVWVARLGAAAQVGRLPPKPLYLRAPDARPQDNSVPRA